MLRANIAIAAILLSASAMQPAQAGDLGEPHAAAAGVAFMRVYARSEPPLGFVRMCARSPEECVAHPGSNERASLTEERFDELKRINRIANQTVQAVSDQEIYGTSEYWTIPVNRGDCEDYALLKQRMLVERGWSAGALLITVVRDEAGQGHAVLTVRTDKGDYVLDNRYEEVRLWSATAYGFVKRQSYLNPLIWMSLEPVVASEPPQSATANEAAH